MSSYTTPQDRTRRRAATAVLIVVVAVFVGWISAISALAGGDAGPPQGGADGSERDSSGQEQAASGETTAEEDAEPTQQDSGGGEPGAGENRQPPVGGGADQQQEGTGEAQTREVFDPLQEDVRQHDGSSGGGQPEQADLDDIGRTRAKAAADRYITAAYGYTGGSGKEYRRRIGRAVDEETFYSSPGGKRVRGYAEAAEEKGITAAAVMKSFEITSTEGSTVEGTAYFRVGKSYDRYSELRGQTTPFAIDLALSEARSSYEVSRAGAEREVSGREIGAGVPKKTS